MALTSRAQRSIDFANKGVPDALGPGTYDPEDISKWRINCSQAPFGSTTHRQHVSSDSQATPGPGHYVDPLAQLDIAPKQSSVFASKSHRMQQDAELPKKAMTPGPGTYNAAYKSWIKASPAGLFSRLFWGSMQGRACNETMWSGGVGLECREASWPNVATLPIVALVTHSCQWYPPGMTNVL